MTIDISPAFEQLQTILTELVRLIPNLILAILVFLLFLWVSGWVGRGIAGGIRRYRPHPSLSIALGRLSQYAFTLLGFLIAAVILFPEFSPADLLGVLGFGSVAIGFAFRDILQNFLAGILLLFTQPFREGDQIVFGSYEGTVEQIETRATLVKTYDGRRVVIPNGQLYTGTFVVNTAYDKRRMEADLDIGYDDDLEQAKALILSEIRQISEVLSDPLPEVIITELREASARVRVRWWVAPPKRRDMMDTRDLVLQRLKNAFQTQGLALPFPVQQVMFYDKTPPRDAPSENGSLNSE